MRMRPHRSLPLEDFCETTIDYFCLFLEKITVFEYIFHLPHTKFGFSTTRATANLIKKRVLTTLQYAVANKV
jgi:hypothetical protein